MEDVPPQLDSFEEAAAAGEDDDTKAGGCVVCCPLVLSRIFWVPVLLGPFNAACLLFCTKFNLETEWARAMGFVQGGCAWRGGRPGAIAREVNLSSGRTRGGAAIRPLRPANCGTHDWCQRSQPGKCSRVPAS